MSASSTLATTPRRYPTIISAGNYTNNLHSFIWYQEFLSYTNNSQTDLFDLSPACWGCGTHRLQINKNSTSTSVLHMTLNNLIASQGIWSTPSLRLLLGSLWPGVVAPDTILSGGQIELFDDLNCVQTSDCLIKLLVIDSNSWNNLTVCKRMLNRIICVYLDYLKLFNCEPALNR